MAETYDPTKNYKWKQTDKFVVSGKALDFFNMILRVNIDAEEYKKFLLVQEASRLMQEVFNENASVLNEMIEEEKEEAVG